MFKDLPQSVIAAVASINQKSRQAFEEEKKALAEKMAAKQMKMPVQPAPKADPAASATAASMAKKNVKEALDPVGKEDADVDNNGKVDKSDSYLKNRRKAISANIKKEEVEQVGEAAANSPFNWKGTPSQLPKKPGEMTGHESKKTDKGMQFTKKPVKEAKDTPGNGYEHQCAIHVKSEQFGEGRTLTTQHAAPDAEGNIEWYDVMFAEGIKRVMTKDIEILESEMHGHATKKKKM